jgi:hypothetical protein
VSPFKKIEKAVIEFENLYKAIESEVKFEIAQLQ